MKRNIVVAITGASGVIYAIAAPGSPRTPPAATST